jgi:hypothetical protein
MDIDVPYFVFELDEIIEYMRKVDDTTNDNIIVINMKTYKECRILLAAERRRLWVHLDALLHARKCYHDILFQSKDTTKLATFGNYFETDPIDNYITERMLSDADHAYVFNTISESFAKREIKRLDEQIEVICNEIDVNKWFVSRLTKIFKHSGEITKAEPVNGNA